MQVGLDIAFANGINKLNSTQMGKYFILSIALLALNGCSLIFKAIDSMPGPYKDRECCYINESKDTIFFNCKKEKTLKMHVIIKNKMENHRLFDLDTIVGNQKAIPLQFIYNRISKDSLLNKYFHIIVTSDKRLHTQSDYWFILDSADIQSKRIIFSHNKTGR